jgi:hypothetical protein
MNPTSLLCLPMTTPVKNTKEFSVPSAMDYEKKQARKNIRTFVCSCSPVPNREIIIEKSSIALW